MKEFKVVVVPDVGSGFQSPFGVDFDIIDARQVLEKCPGMFSVEYVVCGEKYSYYPDTIITLLNDLHLEWGLTRRHESHRMTLCGYPVLEVEFKDEEILFFDPAYSPPQVGRSLVCGPLNVSEVIGELELAVGRVWSFVLNSLK